MAAAPTVSQNLEHRHVFLDAVYERVQRQCHSGFSAHVDIVHIPTWRLKRFSRGSLHFHMAPSERGTVQSMRTTCQAPPDDDDDNDDDDDAVSTTDS